MISRVHGHHRCERVTVAMGLKRPKMLSPRRRGAGNLFGATVGRAMLSECTRDGTNRISITLGHCAGFINLEKRRRQAR